MIAAASMQVEQGARAAHILSWRVVVWSLVVLASAVLTLSAQTNILRSPIADFRDWLTLTPDGRSTALADKPEAQRRELMDKLSEYEKLSDAEREARLLAAELQWYMRPLMELTPANRVDRLARIPEPQRQMVVARLQSWDSLSAERRKSLVANEWTGRYFAQARRPVEGSRENVLERIPDTHRTFVGKRIERLRGMPAGQRDDVVRNFEEFFRLSPVERQKTLSRLSAVERSEMERTLAMFDGLSPEDRQKCLEGFGKFARMSAEERIQFLRNVDRWQQMSQDDRSEWRTLVTTLPPLPPGAGVVLPPMPTP